jgi:hypothetical protein
MTSLAWALAIVSVFLVFRTTLRREERCLRRITCQVTPKFRAFEHPVPPQRTSANLMAYPTYRVEHDGQTHCQLPATGGMQMGGILRLVSNPAEAARV